MIYFDQVSKVYKGGIVAIDDVSFSINAGEFVFFIGESGAGKSSLIKLITCEERPTEGDVFLEDINVGKLNSYMIPYYRRKIGMVFQDYRLIQNKTVYENVAFAMQAVGEPEEEIKRRVPLMLAMVGISGRDDAYPGELSGGEAQRVGIARAVANNPSIIVADEPTGNLDPVNSENIMSLLNEINKSGTTVIACTHDIALVKKMGKRVITMKDGRIIADYKSASSQHKRAHEARRGRGEHKALRRAVLQYD